MLFVNPVSIDLVAGRQWHAAAWPAPVAAEIAIWAAFAAFCVFYLPACWISRLGGGLDFALREAFGSKVAVVIAKGLVPAWASLFCGIFGEAFVFWVPFTGNWSAASEILLWVLVGTITAESNRCSLAGFAIVLTLTMWMMWASGLGDIKWGNAPVAWGFHYLLDAAWIHASLPAVLILAARSAPPSWRVAVAGVVAPVIWTAASMLPIAATEAGSTVAHVLMVSYGAVAMSEAGSLRSLVALALIVGLLPPVHIAARVFANAWFRDRWGRWFGIAVAIAGGILAWRWSPGLVHHAAAPFPAIAGVMSAGFVTSSRSAFDGWHRRAALAGLVAGTAANVIPALLHSPDSSGVAKSPSPIVMGWLVAFAMVWPVRMLRRTVV